VLGRNGVWSDFDGAVTIKAKPVKGNHKLFRTGYVRIVSSLDPRIDPTDKTVVREPGTCYQGTFAGDTVQAKVADSGAFIMDEQVAIVKILPEPPISLWYQALQRAAKCAGLYQQVQNWNTLPGKTAKEISSTILTQVLFKATKKLQPGFYYLLKALYGAD